MKALVTFTFMLVSIPVVADTQYVEVGYLCDKKKDLIDIRYFYYENGVEILQKNEIILESYERFNLWELVETDSKTMKIVNTNSVIKYCVLSTGVYKVKVTPSPGNVNINGRCGAHMSASIKITKPPWYAVKDPETYRNEDGDIFLAPITFESDCHRNGLLTKNILVNGEVEKITLTQVNYLSMHRPLKE